MSTVTAPTAVPHDWKRPFREQPSESVWRAPLAPLALAVSLGIILDRYAAIPLPVSGLVFVVALVAWMASRLGHSSGLPLVYLAVAVAALAAAYHHWQRDWYAADDIGNFVSSSPRPARLRGILLDEPTIVWQRRIDPLRSIPRNESTRVGLQVTDVQTDGDWLPVSGRVQLLVAGQLSGKHVGDGVEVVGQLRVPTEPANPGEFDYAEYLRDQGIRAEMVVRKTTDAVTRVEEGSAWSLARELAIVRGWAQRTLQQDVPEQSGVAVALILGQGSTMTNEDWDIYMRTAVIHVLAISGQHLVVLAFFLWFILRFMFVPRRRGAVFVALFLLLYALLTGGRPPVMRSAVTVCVICGGYLLRRPAMPANHFALAWIVVALLNPTDLFNSGCQLSFLSVAVLYWGIGRWFREEPDALEREARKSYSMWERSWRWIGKTVGLSYAISLVIWLAVAPLVAARYHVVSPVGILLGPPLTLLTSIALIAGFLLLFSALVCWPLVPIWGWVTKWSLSGCEWLVTFGDGLPGAHWYVGDVPEWWLWVWYLAMLSFLMLESLQRRWRWGVLTGLAWCCVGLVSGSVHPSANELRVTFLAVGHGGCTVIESPDGRTLIYDAGALSGPEVTRRQIAPFLWHRGIRRIDEVLLSHADLDHYNGLPALLDRFSIGQVTCTPTFADKDTPGVQHMLAALERCRIPVRIVSAGDRLSAGDVEMEVLHPPAVGPEGNENSRSMVLLIRHADHSLLLTGDLEGAGLQRVLSLPPIPVDVFMAPHHGSRVANTPELAAWAKPKLVVSCEGPPRNATRHPDPYSAKGARFLGTWPHGAITIRSQPDGLIVETYRNGERFAIFSILLNTAPPLTRAWIRSRPNSEYANCSGTARTGSL